MKKVIITGSTGMVGKGVLLECLESPKIDIVLLINRNSLGMKHPKIKEILLADFTQISSKSDQLRGYDGCFFCMGVSSVGMSEAQYEAITYDTTKAFVDVLYELNPDMVFNYVSGEGTDETEQSTTHWKRIKGKTENAILHKGFKDAYAFRPNAIIPEKGIKSKTALYNAVYVLTRPFFPIMKRMDSITTTTRLGQAMINTLFIRLEKKHLENADINELAK